MIKNVSDHDYGDVFEWGLKGDTLVHVNEVSNGLSCGCVCPNCEGELVAYNNPKNKKANHFQHLSKTKCINYHETALHYLAKKIIEEHKTLSVPDVKYVLSGYAESYSRNAWELPEKRVMKTNLTFDEVVLEKNAIDIRPDLKCKTGDKTFYIEIAVTHFTDEIKREKIVKNNFPVLEVDLSKFDRTIQKDRLREILNGDIINMNWIYNPKIDLRKKETEDNARLIKKYISSNIKLLKVYGKERSIFNCPIFKDYDKIKIEDECVRCRYYVSEQESGYKLSDEKPKYGNIFLECIGHKGREFDKLLKSKGISWIEK
jgi:hypothetical protein